MNLAHAGNISQCTKCGDWLCEAGFNMRKDRGVPYRQCRSCMAERKWHLKNPERAKELTARWFKENKELAREYWRKNRKKRLMNPTYRISCRVSNQIYAVLKRGKSGRRWFDLVGYTPDELMAHLSKQFKDGMSWENMGEWHIDHIVPLSSFLSSNNHDEVVKKAWALSNLRPIWAKDNLKKGARMEFLL